MLKYLTFLYFIFCVMHAAHLPTYLNICTRGDGFKKCLLDNIEKNGVNIIKRGEKSLKLPSLVPMKIKKVNMQASESLQVDLEDAELRGIDRCVVYDINMDPDVEDFIIHFTCANIELLGNYKLNGQILVLPIQGNGKINVTLINTPITSKSKLEVIEKDGGKYYNVSPINTEAKPEKVYYKLDNLFNGDKRLGEEMNNFLNENWKEVFTEIGPGVSTIVSIILKTITNAFFNNIPTNELHH